MREAFKSTGLDKREISICVAPMLSRPLDVTLCKGLVACEICNRASRKEAESKYRVKVKLLQGLWVPLMRSSAMVVFNGDAP